MHMCSLTKYGLQCTIYPYMINGVWCTSGYQQNVKRRNIKYRTLKMAISLVAHEFATVIQCHHTQPHPMICQSSHTSHTLDVEWVNWEKCMIEMVRQEEEELDHLQPKENKVTQLSLVPLHPPSPLITSILCPPPCCHANHQLDGKVVYFLNLNEVLEVTFAEM